MNKYTGIYHPELKRMDITDEHGNVHQIHVPPEQLVDSWILRYKSYIEHVVLSSKKDKSPLDEIVFGKVPSASK